MVSQTEWEEPLQKAFERALKAVQQAEEEAKTWRRIAFFSGLLNLIWVAFFFILSLQ